MDVSKKYSIQVYEGETKISTTSYHRVFTVETVRFSPLLDESVVFYFEAIHKNGSEEWNNFNFNPIERSDFILKLIKQTNTNRKQSLVMALIDVKVYFFDGSLLKAYLPLSNITFDQTSSITFETVSCLTNYENQGNLRVANPIKCHSTKMQSGPLALKFKMHFNGNVSDSPLNFFSNLKSTYDSHMFTDFVINVGDKSFSVHKVILAARSPVFTKMLTSDCLESKNNSVDIPDSTPESFDMFLRYLYSGKIGDESCPLVRDLYGLADKYDVDILREDCVDVFISLMSVDLVCEIINVAYTYSDSNLKSAAKQFAVNHIEELLSREDWKQLVAMHPIIGSEAIAHFDPT